MRRDQEPLHDRIGANVAPPTPGARDLPLVVHRPGVTVAGNALDLASPLYKLLRENRSSIAAPGVVLGAMGNPQAVRRAFPGPGDSAASPRALRQHDADAVVELPKGRHPIVRGYPEQGARR